MRDDTAKAPSEGSAPVAPSGRRRRSRALREPFGKAGLTVAVLALLLALVGGAWAAGALTSKQKKEVTKIAKKFAGKPGANGAPGLAGTNGTPGKEGAPGKNGESVTNTKVLTSSAKCEHHGGAELKVGSGEATFACNGQTGFTETLPKGKTLQGEWGFAIFVEGPNITGTGVSFGIPLEAAPAAHYVLVGNNSAKGEGNLTEGSTAVASVTTTSGEFTVGTPISGSHIPAGTTITAIGSGTLTLSAAVEAGGTATGVALTAGLPKGCTGDLANPGAEPGHLCVFARKEENIETGPSICSQVTDEPLHCIGSHSADPFGFGVYAEAGGAGFLNANGTWAVTAAE